MQHKLPERVNRVAAPCDKAALIRKRDFAGLDLLARFGTPA
jgi:hypothetical protein